MLAIKAAFMSFTGLFAVSLIKLIYKEPRPYWVVVDIQAYLCSNDFDGPSESAFVLMFLGTYLNLIYLRKYARTPHLALSWVLFIFQGLFLIVSSVAGLLLGHTHLTSSLMGVVYGFFFVLVFLQVDNQVHLLVMKSVFIQKRARKNKFYLFFLASGLLVIATTAFNLEM